MGRSETFDPLDLKRRRDRRHDRNRQALKPWRNWYKRKAWRDRRAHQLALQPLCEWCLKKGLVTPATEVHHSIPHRGEYNLFINGELVSLCKHCHDSDAQRLEQRGYDDSIGQDGWPIDPRHPANRTVRG